MARSRAVFIMMFRLHNITTEIMKIRLLDLTHNLKCPWKNNDKNTNLSLSERAHFKTYKNMSGVIFAILPVLSKIRKNNRTRFVHLDHWFKWWYFQDPYRTFIPLRFVPIFPLFPYFYLISFICYKYIHVLWKLENICSDFDRNWLILAYFVVLHLFLQES